MAHESTRRLRPVIILPAVLALLVFLRFYVDFVVQHKPALSRWITANGWRVTLAVIITLLIAALAGWVTKRWFGRRLIILVSITAGAVVAAMMNSLIGAALGLLAGLFVSSQPMRRWLWRLTVSYVPCFALAAISGWIGWAAYYGSPGVRQVIGYVGATILIVAALGIGQLGLPLLRDVQWFVQAVDVNPLARSGHSSRRRAVRRLRSVFVSLVVVGVAYLGLLCGRQYETVRRIQAIDQVGTVYWKSVRGRSLLWMGPWQVTQVDLHATATDRDLAMLRGFPRMRSLGIHASQITDDGCRVLVEFRNLEYLSLSGLDITDDGLDSVAALEKLQTVYVNCANISTRSLPALVSSNQLIHLTIERMRNVGEGFAGVSRARRLRSVKVIEADLTDDDLVHFKGLRWMEHLSLRGCKIQGPGLRHLASSVRLARLDLSDNPLNTDYLQNLNSLALTLLWLEGVSITPSGEKAIARQSLLQQLGLSRTEVNDRSLRTMIDPLSLRWLKIDGTRISSRCISSLRGTDVHITVSDQIMTWADVQRLGELGHDVHLIRCTFTPGAIAELFQQPRVFRLTDCETQPRFRRHLVRRYSPYPRY